MSMLRHRSTGTPPRSATTLRHAAAIAAALACLVVGGVNAATAAAQSLTGQAPSPDEAPPKQAPASPATDAPTGDSTAPAPEPGLTLEPKLSATELAGPPTTAAPVRPKTAIAKPTAAKPAAKSAARKPATAAATPSATAKPTLAATAAKPVFGAWGVELDQRDTSVAPGQDFDRYATGHWHDTTTIPADRPGVGSGSDLRERVQGEVRDLITAAPKTGKLGGLYQSFMDEERLEALGVKPLKPDLATIAALPDKLAFARFMATTMGSFGISLFDYGVMPDFANSEMNVLQIGQGGLGMPNRDYYLDDQFKPQRQAYHEYIARTMLAIGLAASDADAQTQADTILAFETMVAKASWAPAERRNLDKLNNHYSSAELASYAPGVDWDAFLAGAKLLPQKTIIVTENSAVQALAALYDATPLDTLKLWEAFHLADQASPYLNTAMVDSNFAYERTLTGVGIIRPRWKRGVDLVSDSLGELVGRAFVTKYFPPMAKAHMQALVANLKEAMAGRIAGNGWMSTETKTAALAKLAKMKVMVGYPDKWRDYSALTIDPADLYGNVQRAGRFNAAYDLADLGKPVDHAKWAMTPQTVNAYNGFLENKIVFPAGILQPPFFDPAADDAVNYGAIGAIIGHEISHGFDDQGRKVDATGTLHDWWTQDDATRFAAQTKVFGEQYGKFEALPGVFVNPALTMGENIADFAGLQAALDAYHASLKGKPAPVLDGLSGDQRFFLAYAQAWRNKTRDDTIRKQVATDPHSPARFRVLGPLPNIDAWYDAFGVKPGDTMYIPSEQRARIW